MDVISIELDEGMTLGALRQVARSLGKRLVISFQNGSSGSAARPVASRGPEPAARSPRRKRRKLSPEARAALAKNLEKARAVQAAKRKKLAKGPAKA